MTATTNLRRRPHTAASMARPLKPTKTHAVPTFHRSITQDADELIQLGVDTIDGLLARDSGHDGTEWTAAQTSRTRRDDSGVSFWTGKVPGHSIHAVKATCVVGCAAVQLANKLKEPTRLREYDATIFGCRIVEEVDVTSFTTIQFWQGVPLFPATAREFCVLTAERRLPNSHGIVLAARSIDHVSVPHNPAYIRGEMYLTGFILRPIDSSSCMVTALRHVNMRGAAAPFVGRKAEDVVAILKNLQRLFGKVAVPDQVPPVAAVAPLVAEQRPEPAETSSCSNCGKDVVHGYSRHRCVVCHCIFCGDCARHVVKTKKWQVLRMCNPCAAENVPTDRPSLTERPSLPSTPVMDEASAAQPPQLAVQLSPATLLVVGAVATVVVWMEWPGHTVAVLPVLVLAVLVAISRPACSADGLSIASKSFDN